jgi:hypothetical protein
MAAGHHSNVVAGGQAGEIIGSGCQAGRAKSWAMSRKRAARSRGWRRAVPVSASTKGVAVRKSAEGFGHCGGDYWSFLMTGTLQEMAEAGLVTLSNSQDTWNTIAIVGGSQPSEEWRLF